MEEIKLLSTQEISQHNSSQDCWLVIDEAVWDCTSFADSHPGGSSLILRYAGRDATKAYSEIHSPSIVRNSLSPECFKGNLDRSTIDEAWTKEPLPSNPAQAVPENGKPSLHTIINLNDFEEASAKSASAKTHAFYSTAATDCWTRDMNSAMLKRMWFRPRVLKDVADVDTSSSMLGIPLRVPVFICPSGLAKMINPEGEKALARAAKSSGIVEIVSRPSASDVNYIVLIRLVPISTNASFPAAEIVEQAPDHPFMFQLYVNKDRKKSEELVKHVERLGVKAIFVTVDAAGRGKRESDERLRVDEVALNPLTGQKSATGKKGGGLTKIVGQFIDQSLTWEDLKWLRSLTKLPILLKGIMTAEDAKLAMKHKVEGILISNHGGRNLDFSPPSILILLEMHKQCPEIFDQMEVYVDGGFRRGGDILKALCLGAKAVGMGRPFLFALNYGTEGAKHLVEILKDEMESAMKLLGIKNWSEVHPGLVNTSDVDHLVPSTPDHPYAKWRPKARI